MDEHQKELLFEVLELLAAGALVAGAVVAPGMLIALAPFVAKKLKSDHRDVYRALRYAKQQEWIHVVETNEGIKAEMTPRGHRRWQQLAFDRPLVGTHWDGKWRLVIFDIPNKRKIAREGIRDALKRLGFHQLQESVWITPWPCLEHVDALRHFYLVPRNVQMLETSKIEYEASLLSSFNLQR